MGPKWCKIVQVLDLVWSLWCTIVQVLDLLYIKTGDRQDASSYTFEDLPLLGDLSMEEVCGSTMVQNRTSFLDFLYIELENRTWISSGCMFYTLEYPSLPAQNLLRQRMTIHEVVNFCPLKNVVFF